MQDANGQNGMLCLNLTKGAIKKHITMVEMDHFNSMKIKKRYGKNIVDIPYELLVFGEYASLIVESDLTEESIITLLRTKVNASYLFK